jgi:hypothetical protein
MPDLKIRKGLLRLKRTLGLAEKNLSVVLPGEGS